jgi:hypothetical protein
MHKTLQLLNILGLALVLTLNSLANALPINGYTTGELSDMYPNLFTPAGFTFSIWGLIFIWLIAFCIAQAKGLFGKAKPRESVGLIGLWFFISCLANGGWILAWHYQFVGLSVLIMLLLLFSLITIYRNLGIGIRNVSATEKWLVHAPFSLYLGWISVATIANLTAFLVDIGFEGLGIPQNFYAALVILVSGLLGLFFLNKNRDIVYVGVLLWAYFGIYYKRTYLDTNLYPLITTTLAACALLLLFRAIKGPKNKTIPSAYL